MGRIDSSGEAEGRLGGSRDHEFNYSHKEIFSAIIARPLQLALKSTSCGNESEVVQIEVARIAQVGQWMSSATGCTYRPIRYGPP